MVGVNAIIRHKKWQFSKPPKKILAIRFQALGDTLITLPYLYDLKTRLPDSEIHLLTRENVSSIPKEVLFFDSIITIGERRGTTIQFICAIMKIPFLLLKRYDVVIDLQNNWISKFVRRCLLTKAWSEFDKLSANSAGERTRWTIEALGLTTIKLNTSFARNSQLSANVIAKYKFPEDHKLVVLNPAGFFPSRNWPIANYIAYAKLWLEKIDSKTRFVLLLLPDLQARAETIKKNLGDACIDLTGKANQVEAFHILRQCTFILTEDSGLMHMAWIQGVPTLALFSSSRKDWSQPCGENSLCLDSSDLDCGPCLRETCIFGDNPCLTRYTPEFVISKTKQLLNY